MLITRTYLLAALSILIVPCARCQDPQTQQNPSAPQQQQNPPAQQPVQPEKPLQPSQSGDQSGQPGNDQPPVPPIITGTVYNTPITGAGVPPFGIFSSRSYLVPAVEYFGQLDSNGTNITNGGFASINSILGAISAQKTTNSSQLNVDYMVGRSFSNQANAFNSTTSDLNVSDLWTRGRWDGFIADQMLYSSQSAFLGGVAPFELAGLGTVAGIGTGPIVLRNTFLPGQGIFTNFGPRLSNATVAQINNHLSRRTFFTLVGNYNTLRFFNSGLIDSSAAGFQAGLGFQRTREDAIALIYRFDDLWFGGFSASVRDNTVELAYQRQVAQRWQFQIGAGPEISLIQAPNELTSGPASNRTRVSWAADASLRYQLRRTEIAFGYDHYLTNGGGVFLGSIRDGVYGSVNRELSRLWRISFTGSYTHNKDLIPLPATLTGGVLVPPNAAFNSVYGGVEVHRRVLQDSDLFFGYLARYQTSNYTVCLNGTAACIGPSVVGHLFNFGFLWRVRPIPIG